MRGRVVRPEGPSCNSHDRKVVVKMFSNIREVRRTGMNSYRPVGPQLFLLGDSNPDLTVGAIAWRRFAPHEPAKRVSA